MLQNTRDTAFVVSELLRVNQPGKRGGGGGIKLPRLKVTCFFQIDTLQIII